MLDSSTSLQETKLLPTNENNIVLINKRQLLLNDIHQLKKKIALARLISTQFIVFLFDFLLLPLNY